MRNAVKSSARKFSLRVYIDSVQSDVRRFLLKIRDRLYQLYQARKSRILSSLSHSQLSSLDGGIFRIGKKLRLKYFSTIRGVSERDPTIFTLEGWLYYIKALDVSMGLLFFVLALFSLIFLLKRKDKRAVFFFISVIIPYLILTAMSNKGDRYILPVLPVLAVSTAIFLRELPHAFRRVEGKKLQRFLMAVILFVGMMQLLTVTVGFPKIENSLLYPKPVAPDTADWKIDELLSAINQNGGGAVVVLPDHPYLNGQSLNFYRLKNGYNFPVFNGVYIGYETVKANFDRIKYFVLIEPREHGSEVFGGEEARLYQLFYERQRNFERIAQFSLPDNTSLLLYERKE